MTDLTPEDVERIHYAAGHLHGAEMFPEHPHTGDSTDLGLDVIREGIALHVAEAVAAEKARAVKAEQERDEYEAHSPTDPTKEGGT